MYTMGPCDPVLIVTEMDSKWIAEMDGDLDREVQEGYANMLAAAPDMLAACEEVLNEVAAGCDLSEETCKLLETAIAKAEGSSK